MAPPPNNPYDDQGNNNPLNSGGSGPRGGSSGSNRGSKLKERLEKVKRYAGYGISGGRAANKVRKQRKKIRKERERSGASELSGAEDSANVDDGNGEYNIDSERGEAGADSETNGYYNPEDQGGFKQKMNGLFGRQAIRRNSIIAVLLIGITGTGGIGFFAAAPLKVEHMVQNIQDKYDAGPTDAMTAAIQHMLQRYLIEQVLPSYKECGTTVSRKCSVSGNGLTGANPVHNMFRSWRDAGFERKLADKYHIEFEYEKTSNTWRVKSPHLPKEGVDIGSDGSGMSKVYIDKGEYRRDIDFSMKKETKWYQYYLRYKVDNFLDRKYSLRFCTIFCGITDPIDNKITEKRNAAKMYIVKKVILPRSQLVGLTLACLLEPSCRPTDTEATSEVDGTTQTSAADSDFDIDSQQTLLSYDEEIGNKTFAEIAKIYRAMGTEGPTIYFLKIVMEKAGLGAISDQVTGAVPIVGWIAKGSLLIDTLNNAGPALKKMSYVVNSTAVISMYMMYRSYADEIHTGNVDPVEVGAFANSFGTGKTDEFGNKPTGGTARAESSPVYQSIMHDKQPDSGVASSGLFGHASAATSEKTSAARARDRTCEDGQPAPEGKLCDSLKLGQGSAIANRVHNFLNLPVVGAFTQVAHVISGIIGKTLAPVDWLAEKAMNAAISIFHLGGAVELVGKIVQPFFTAIIGELIVNPVGDSGNNGGARNLELAAAGGDALSNEYCHNGLGCKKVDDVAITNLRNKVRAEQQLEFSHKPLFARMFDTSSKYSLVTKMAIAVPLGNQDRIHAGVASLTNPLRSISSGFGVLLTGRANAVDSAQPDEFGIPQYMYGAGDVPDNPGKYWDDNCSIDNPGYGYRKTNDWNEAAASGPPDELNAMPVNTTVNPCMLIMAASGSAGAFFDMNLLTEDERSLVGADEGATASTALVSGSAKELAQEILDTPKIDINEGSYCRHCQLDIKNMAQGKPAYGDVSVNEDILKFLVDLGSQTKININSITGEGSGHSTGSKHYTGDAVDFECGFDEKLADKVARKYNLMAENERCDNGVNHSHFSKDGY